MKNFLSTTALALVLATGTAATGVMAANHTVMLTRGDGSEAMMPAERDMMFQADANYAVDGYEMYTDPLTVADIEEAPLYSSITGDEIGEVEDTVSENGELRYLVLDIGGFLGIGEKTIAVAPNEVMAMRNPGLGDTRIYINATEEQLNEVPDYNSQAAAAMESAVGTLDGEGVVATGEGTVVPSETVSEPDTMGEPIVAEDEAMLAEDPDATVVVAEGAADAMTDTAETVVVETEAAADTMVAETDAAVDTMATDGFMMRDGTPAAAPIFAEGIEADPNYTVDGYETYTGSYTDMLTEGDVEEAPLYSAVTGEEIGEVEDALTQNGVLSALVLDIGGFLGLGEHTITVSPDQVTYVRDPGLLSSVRVYINATKEQLEAVPSYNADL